MQVNHNLGLFEIAHALHAIAKAHYNGLSEIAKSLQKNDLEEDVDE